MCPVRNFILNLLVRECAKKERIGERGEKNETISEKRNGRYKPSMLLVQNV